MKLDYYFHFSFAYNSRAVLGYQSTSSAGIRILTNRFQARLHAPAVPGQDAPLDSCSPTQAFSHVRENYAGTCIRIDELVEDLSWLHV